jgi:arylsulfatase
MCTPTRGQLMTGVDCLRNGAMNVSSGRTLLRREFPTMPEIFAGAGYSTAIFGKWHLGDNYPYRPQDRGYQESVWFPSSHVPSAAGHFNNDYFDDVYEHDGRPQQYEGYCTDVFFREAKAWMRQQAERHTPFFCYLPLNAPHGPLFVPDRYREPYRKQKPAIASFYGMIANIDENMERLETFLRETRLRENTILIFMSDNGTATGDPVFNAGMRGKKISLYEGGHRVPLFVRWPAGKLRAAGDVPALAEVQDILPTLLDLCGVTDIKGAKLDGTSLAPLLRGTAEALPDRMLVTQFSRMNAPVPKRGDACVMWNRWRLVADTELYDLVTDPAQEHNVIAEHADIAERMREHYARWWTGVGPRVNEIGAIHIGAPQENPARLSTCDWRDVFLDQQGQIRTAKKNGSWTLFAERDGEYDFELRRWPREADAAITAPMPAYKGADGSYAAGVAFPAASAEIKIGETRETKPVGGEDKSVTFRVALKRGPHELRTSLRDAAGAEIAGAYYVYVRAL